MPTGLDGFMIAVDVMLGLMLIALYPTRAILRARVARVTEALAHRQRDENAEFRLKERELEIATRETGNLFAESESLKRRAVQLRIDSDTAARRHFDIVHLVGEPGGDRRRFDGVLLAPGGPNGLPQRIAKASHIVVVYADTISAARRLLDVSYNARSGYSVLGLAEHGAPQRVAPADAPFAREAAR